MKARLFPLVGLFALSSLIGCTGSYVESAPPELQVEARLESPGPNAVWIDGHWGWRNHAYYWVPGYWERHPRGQWIAGQWTQQGRGYRWRRGHWDHHR